VVVVVSLCGREGEAVVVVVVVSRRGGEYEENEIQPVNNVDAKMTAIKFCSVARFLIPLSLPYF
jgi:hypothetical protein